MVRFRNSILKDQTPSCMDHKHSSNASPSRLSKRLAIVLLSLQPCTHISYLLSPFVLSTPVSPFHILSVPISLSLTWPVSPCLYRALVAVSLYLSLFLSTCLCFSLLVSLIFSVSSPSSLTPDICLSILIPRPYPPTLIPHQIHPICHRQRRQALDLDLAELDATRNQLQEKEAGLASTTRALEVRERESDQLQGLIQALP